ncbi:uncharacterized protein I303_100749 [Kwoniella dejecticola CBS 10117]|uniref:MHD domain-containing protein n=1 Tax=Kwoniella dejecticola CBS 10117 TaxID=1296121 RepID=A0A1A6AFX9_9TREE|nr:uncharacterized protein I303_00751 [Kwoniella dejecticola CBS 10117]OBR88933.1 hypothetical protein I303_00751 [Kwoniella dejecticola CBS 10117]
MSELLPEDTWVNNFLPTPPRPLLSALQRRLHTSTTHVNALAEVYKQRAQIEATYAESLSKLAKTAEQGGLSGKSGNEWEKASGEGRLWDSVISELSETSASHSTLSAMLRTDFEQPLRDLPSKVIAWRRIGEQDASLDRTLKDYEKVSGKLEKAQQKAKSSKADQLHSELNQLTAQLASLSPMVYTTYQRLDEERLRTLKEVIVRWGTVKGDIATRDGQRAEGIIANLLSWETSEEVLGVGRKLGNIGGNGNANGYTPRLSAPDSATSTPVSNRRMSTVTSSSQAQDFSPRPAPRQNGSSASFNKEQSGGGLTGGFKSMLGRKKTLAGVGRTRSGSNATSTRSGRDETPREAPFDLMSDDVPRIQGSTSSAPPVDEEGFSVAPADRHRSLWEEPNEVVPAPSTAQSQTHFGTTFTSSPSASQENLSSSASSQHAPPKLNLSLAPAPIQESEEERQAALQKMQQTLQMPPSQPSRRSTIARGRRDVRNTMFAGGLSEEQSSGLGGLALGKVSEPEERLADSPTSAASPTSFTNGTGNGLGDRPGQVARQVSMSSVTSNNPFDSPSLGGPTLTQPTLPSTSSEAGLRANLNETINVIIKNKEVTKIQITGEIHLSLRPTRSQPTTGPIHIRLTSFETLEKIAPNPAYLAQVPDRPGEYFLNSEVLASATSSSKSTSSDKGALLFKYVVHIQPGKEGSSAPLMLDPAFLCKEGETRMILNYSLQSQSQQNALEGLNNVSFVAIFGNGPAVNNVQAKPAGGVWSPSQRRMTWKMDQLPIGQGKIIAKFITDATTGESLTPQNVLVTFNSEGVLASGLGIEVVDGDIEGHDWRFEEIKKGVISGKYSAEAHVNQS